MFPKRNPQNKFQATQTEKLINISLNINKNFGFVRKILIILVTLNGNKEANYSNNSLQST